MKRIGIAATAALVIGLCLYCLAPTLLPLVHAQSSHSVTLTWTYTQGADPATGFFVERATSAAGPFTSLNATALPTSTLTYVDSTGTGGTTYFYQVYAVDASGDESLPDGPVSATFLANPAAPQGLAAVSK